MLMLILLTQATDSEPYVIWLSGLHVPESYLTALVQATCRKNGWPLDRSTLYTSVTNYADPEDVTERIHQGNYNNNNNNSNSNNDNTQFLGRLF